MRYPQHSSSAWHQRGVGLIEILITMLVLGIGLLGIAAMQATALRNAQSSLERSQAVIQTYSILDAMRANRVSAIDGDYVVGLSADCDDALSATLANDDVDFWRESLGQVLGSDACGAISMEGAAGSGNVLVTIQWNDARGNAGSAAQQLMTRTQL